MNDLDKKRGTVNGDRADSSEIPQSLGTRTTSQLYYKKLGAYLLLLYQSYLKGETTLEPEIKMALWRMVKFNNDFQAKIRMAQLDILQTETQNLNAEWDENKETLFPMEIDEPKQVENELDSATILEYKEEVLSLLGSKRLL